MTPSISEEKLIEYQKVAAGLAFKAGEIMKKNFSLNVHYDWKNDNTPITIADRQINALVLDTISKNYPGHSIIAEEKSILAKDSEDVWVCDPLDGTTPFSHGYATFTFSISFVRRGEVLMGLIYDPINNHLASAIKGKGTHLNGKKIFVSSEAKISKTSMIDINCDFKLLHLREMLIKKTDCYAPVLYSAAYASLLVASGNFLAEVFEYNNPWDGAASKIIVEEAGGKVTDLQGREQRYDQEINGYVASNKFVHQELLDLISATKLQS